MVGLEVPGLRRTPARLELGECWGSGTSRSRVKSPGVDEGKSNDSGERIVGGSGDLQSAVDEDNQPIDKGASRKENKPQKQKKRGGSTSHRLASATDVVLIDVAAPRP
jgi:hypothetical protein